MKELRANELSEIELSLCLSTSTYLEAARLRSRNRFWTAVRFRGKERLSFVLNTRRTLRTIRAGKYDVFHPTFFDPYFLEALPDRPFVMTIYDMIHEAFPEQFPTASVTISQKKRLALAANRIIAISDHTRNDVLRLYPELDASKVVTVHLGCSPSEPVAMHEKKLSPEGPFFLYVGRRAGYKNFSVVVKALSLLVTGFPTLRLLCSGGGRFSTREIELATRCGVSEKLLLVDASDSELRLLYREAVALVYPSTYEGFGLPILEAFCERCPVIASPSAAIPEVGEDAIAYFDANDASSLSETMARMLSDADFRREMTDRGSRRAGDFTWSRTARETVKVYAIAVESHRAG